MTLKLTTPIAATLLTGALLAGCGDGDGEVEQVDPLGCEAAESTVVVNPQDNPRGVEGDSRNLGPLVDTERGFVALRPVEDREHDAFIYDREGGQYQYTGYFDYQGFVLGAVADDYVAYTFNSEAPRDGDKVGRIQVIDLALPGEPVIAAEMEVALEDQNCYGRPMLGRARIAKANDTLFVPCEETVATVDVTDACAPSMTSIEALPDISSETPIEHELVLAEEVDEETTRLYVITRLRESNERRLGIYDVTDTITTRGSFVFPETPRQLYDIELRDGKLYAVHGKLYIIDVSDPVTPSLISSTELEGQSGGFDFRDGKLWMTVLTPDPGLMRFVQRWDVSNPANPQMEQSWDVGSQFTSLWDLQIRDGSIYATGVTSSGW